MSNLENISKIFRKALLAEERKLPSDASLAALPSIYKGVGDVTPFIEMGFQHQLAGGGGTAVGEGVYARLELSDTINLIYSYGPGIIEGKVLGGFQNYIMFDGDRFPNIRSEIIKNYGRDMTPAEQIQSIVPDYRDAQVLISEGRNMNYRSHSAKLCRKYGIRGLMYKWDGVATVLPFDFSSVIVWAVIPNARRDRHLVKVFDNEARERYEKGFDWDFQLYGRYDWYDRTKITRVSTNNEMYALVRDNNKGYNFVHLDTRIVTKPEPKEISDIWFKSQPSLPSIRNGIFSFQYNGMNFFATVFLPQEKTTALWYPEDINKLYSPDINSVSDWVDLDLNTLNEVYQELKNIPNGSLVSESISEEIHDKSERDFLDKNRTYIYRATGMSTIKSIFENGQLRQFAGSNDGSWYGEGVYAVIRPQDVQYHKYDKERGSCGIKMIVQGGFSRFLIFHEEWANRVYGPHHTIKDQIYRLLDQKDADFLWKETEGFMRDKFKNCQATMGNEGIGRTTGLLHVWFDNKQFWKKYLSIFSRNNVKGAIYLGGNDGLSCVCWNFNEIIPYQYTTDRGRTWNSDFFDFEKTKARAFRDNDPSQKFRHLYDYIDQNVISCKIQDKKINVVPVKTKEGKWNIININTPDGEKISPIDFDSKPTIGLSGLFAFLYKGIKFQGVLYLPGTDGPALWYPEDMAQFNSRPNMASLNDWVDLTDIDEVLQELNGSQQ